MGKALTYIGGFLLVVLSALLIVPQVVDWNNFRGAFEEEASRVLGREVRVGGRVNLALLPVPQVHFEKIRIADTAGTLGEPFFRAESFNMGLAIAPLLRGALEATQIELRQPVLTVAIDGEGRGSWRDVVISPGALPFLPAEVRLRAVQIADGTLALRRSGEGELIRLSGINGELSADNLDGPYRFRGVLAWHGQPREVRVSTAAQDADGGLRFKGYVRVPQTGSTYTVDGKLDDLAGKPRVEGDLAARIPLPSVPGADATVRKGDADRDVLDLRSKVKGDAFAISLPDLALSFDQGGQPQLVAGAGEASWRDGVRLKLSLDSKWLDLDRISGSAAQAGPTNAVRQLVPALVSLLPVEGQVDARVGVEQATIGGEAASDLRLHIERFRGPMQVRELQAVLPGGTRLDLNGTVSVQADSTSFTGDLAVRGSSYAKFLGWAAKGQTLIDTSKQDGAFALQGQLALNAQGLEVANASAELLGGQQLTGAVGFVWEGRKRIDLRLDGQQIDMSSALAGGLDPARIKPLLWPDAFPDDAKAHRPPLMAIFDAKTMDARVAIKAGELSDGERVFRDVDATITVEQGKLQLGSFKVTTPEGMRLDAEGELRDITGQPKGVLRGGIAVLTPASLDGVLRALGRDGAEPGQANLGRLEALLPLRLAGSLQLGARGAGSTDIAVDGVVKGSRTVAGLRLDGGPAKWRDTLVDVTGSVESAAVGLSLANVLLGGGDAAAPQAGAMKGGQLIFKASGLPGKGLVAIASLRGDGLALEFDGKLTQTAAGTRDVAGLVRVEAARGEPVLALLGAGSISGLKDAALSGSAEVASIPTGLRIKPLGLRLAGSEISGRIDVSRDEASAVSVDAAVSAARATVPGLLSMVLDAGPARGGETQGGQEQVWPDAAFNFSALEKVRGRLKLNVSSLVLDQGLELADAFLEAELSPGQVAVTNLDGRALGGELKAKLAFEKTAGAGASLAGALKLDDARLETLAGKAAATGSASLLLQFSGRALSPQSLIAVLQGKGEVTLSGVQLLRHSPSAVPRAVEALLNSRADAPADGPRGLLLNGLSSAAVRIGQAKLGLQIADGALKIDRLRYETADARASVETAVELATLRFDSEWRMEAKAPIQRAAGQAGAKAPHEAPGISLVYVGPLRAVGATEPRLNTDAFERVVTLIRMEREVEELERLRREDEERVKREQERQRVIEEERKRALDAGHAAPGAASPTLPAPSPAAPAASGASAPPSPPAIARPGAAALTGTTGSTSAAAAPPPEAAQGAPPQAEGDTANSPSSTGAPGLDFPKRPARPTRPAAQQPPKFSPFGNPGLGTN